jgi:MFS family permease
MARVLSAFALAYALLEIPSGWLADRIGPRKVLTRIVVWWSAFTMVTGAARSYGALLAVRFLFGAGEAGALPSASNAVSHWFPTSERGKANGAILFGTRVGGMIGLPLVLLLIDRFGWRTSFAMVGSIGFVWAAAWFACFATCRPRTRPSTRRNSHGSTRIGHRSTTIVSRRRRGGRCCAAEICT